MWQTGLTSDDVKFIGSLLTHVEDTLCVDENRVFVTGYSNGAFLTSSIACVYADRVAAVAPVAGLENPSRCHPARHIPIVAFHGTKDPFVSYTGGLGPSAMKLEAPDGKGTLGSSLGKGRLPTGPSIPSITASWASREGCASKPTDSAVATAVTLIRYQCPGGTEVELYRVTGGGHAWPGSAISASIKSVVGYTTMAISADQIMWDFFEAHPLRH
jgi:polyhydroxybutyrate depolymerase